MKGTDYAYAVARIRVHETRLLTLADMERLIAAPDLSSAFRILTEKGWTEGRTEDDFHDILRMQSQKVWQLLKELSIDMRLLEFILIRNDYHNIKAAVKFFVSESILTSNFRLDEIFIEPSIINPDQLKNAILNRKYGDLPEFAQNAIQKAYDLAIRTLDGQQTDILLDAMALDAVLEAAGKSGSRFIEDIAERTCVAANLRIALRASRTGKDRQFLHAALCETKTLRKEFLIDAALKGPDEFIRLIGAAGYGQAAQQIRISDSAFEKWCDDMLMSVIAEAKYHSFGIEPCIAYYYAKDAEIKSVRIILSCKRHRIPPETIRERVRKLYV